MLGAGVVSNTAGHVDYIDVKVYWVTPQFTRRAQFLRLKVVGQDTNAEGLTKIILRILEEDLKVNCASCTLTASTALRTPDT